MKQFYLNDKYFTDVLHVDSGNRIIEKAKNENRELTTEELIAVLKDEGQWSSYYSKDHEEFSRLRFSLEEQNYIKVQRSWNNGDRVLKPFKLNNIKFEVNDQFSCAGAIKFQNDKANIS
jgi:hypothetical protein